MSVPAKVPAVVDDGDLFEKLLKEENLSMKKLY
jgi:hypothetical protein